MKETLSKMTYDEKKMVDKLFIDELVSENRKKIETEEFSKIIWEVLNIDDKRFIYLFKKFWEFHNEFNNEFIDKIISYEHELSPHDLELILKTIKFASEIDYEWLALSWVLKQKADYLISKLKNIYNRKSINTIPNKWSFFTRYKRHHLIYLYSLKTNNPHLSLLKKAIINQYHSWDEQLFNIRLQRDFKEFLNFSEQELTKEIETLENHPKKIEWIDEKNLNEILIFDNLIEYKYISQLQWLPALTLNQIAKDIVKKENKDPNKIEESLSKIIEEKKAKFNNHVDWYQQTWLTCSAASLLMALNYFYWTEFSKKTEHKIADEAASEFIPWQHYSWIWLFALNQWLKTKLIHSDTNFFQNPWFSEWLFNYLMHEYESYYNEFLENGWVVDFNPVSNEDIIRELQNGYLVLLAWKYGDILHTKLITWYDIPNKTFNLIDPLMGIESIESFENVQKFCTTSLWKWMLAVKKTNFEKWDIKDSEWEDQLKYYMQKFSEFKKSLHKKEDVIGIDNIMFYDYHKFWSKWYNLSILKNNWLNVSDGITLSLSCIDDIKAWIYDTDLRKKDELINQIESTLWPWPYIVRSNFIWEDWWNKSYAWCFESYLNIDRDYLYEAIIKVLKSGRLDESNELNWWVLIQKMIYWDNSWVAFVDDEWISIDITEWLNDKLVSWEITPETIKLKANWSSEWNISFLNNNNIDNLRDSLFKIKKIFNKWMDVEFTIKNWTLYILQARPITTNLNYSVDSLNLQSNIWNFDTIVISKWNFEWKIKIIENPNDINSINENCIIITNQLYPDLITKAHKIKGIISEKWWQLAHLSIVWREMGIPILSWCEWIVAKSKDKKEVFYKDDFILFR